MPPELLPWQTKTDSKEKAIKLENEKAIHLKRFGSSLVPFIVITKYTIELQPSNDFSASTIMEWYSNFMLQYPERQQQIKIKLIIYSIWLWYCFECPLKSKKEITEIITLYLNRIILSMLHDESIIIVSEKYLQWYTVTATHNSAWMH